MLRREFIAAVAAAASHRPPNVVLVLADDLGWAELGCFGSRFNETPNLDRLARAGVRFTNAYAAAPVCSPTRAALMTGLHPARVGITDFLEARDEKFLSPDGPSLPQALERVGYTSALIGKWHLMGDYASRRGDPKLHGFDQVICSESKYIAGGDYWHPYFFMPEVEARVDSEYLTDRLNREAVDFIDRNHQQPFFLYLAHYAPHTRLDGKPELVSKYKGKPGASETRNNPALAAMLESIDEGIGMIEHALRRHGIEQDTIFIFTSDNGGEGRVTSNAPLRGAKSELYEGGIRVPLLMRWHRAAKPGAICETPVVTTDLHATLLAAAGIRSVDPLDGQDIRPMLSSPRRERTFYWHYPRQKPHFLGGRSSGAIRDGNWKLIEYFDTGKLELYDLGRDPGETTDLSTRSPKKATQLHEKLKHWRSTVLEK
jgi:arylsulfatase A-like enzyme